ncbi:hypothetical protein HMPREF1869_00702, partial [Bacteroidales bacterium KA00251]
SAKSRQSCEQDYETVDFCNSLIERSWLFMTKEKKKGRFLNMESPLIK